MASGRFINNSVCADKKINQLSDDTSRLAFTWLITFADCEGRTYGDPELLCSMLFPRRRDVTPEQMEGYIREWAAAGMIVWYSNGGDAWIWFPNFEDNQPNLRKDREAPSRIPEHDVEGSVDLLLSKSGVSPDKLPVKRKEKKLKDTPAAKPPAPFMDAPTVMAYRDIFRTTPNEIQRKEISERVTDLSLWKVVCEGWNLHGWKPGNIPGLIDAYLAGGIQPVGNSNGFKPLRPNGGRRPIDGV